MSIYDIQYVTVRNEDYVEPLKTLLRDHSKEITLKPLYDETWEKIKILVEADGESIAQAIEIADAIDPRYLASIMQAVSPTIKKQDFSYELSKWIEGSSNTSSYFSLLWEEIDIVEITEPFVCWLYKGKVVENGLIYKVVMKHYGIEEGVTKISSIKTEIKKPFFTVTMEGYPYWGRLWAEDCLVNNETCPNVNLSSKVELQLYSVDKIDISNALNYTDTPIENIQRDLMYLSVDLDGVYRFKNSDLNKKSFIEATGELFFISPNGRAIPLDQSAEMKILVKFPNAMVAALK